MSTTRTARIPMLLLAAAGPLAACSGGLPASGSPMDASVAQGDLAPLVNRSMTERPLFGDVHPQNLFNDPNFSVRQAGLGTWDSLALDPSQPRPTLASSPMSDAPAGIAVPVARFSDSTMATQSSDLALITQVPGGPGPFHLRVWLSTLDATQSAMVDSVTVGLLTSLDASAISVVEDLAQAKVIAGRTWHLYTGDIAKDLSLGAFVEIQFPASSNTWLLQSPEFIPKAIAARPKAGAVPGGPQAPSRARPMTAREKQMVDHYRHQPRISVPASHPILDEDRPQKLLRP